MRTLKEKVDELKVIKKEIAALYKKKSRLERLILDEIDETIVEYKQTMEEQELNKIEITIDDLVEAGITYEKKLNHDLLKHKFPNVYMWGRKIIFDYNTALLSFTDKKKFWKVIAECTETKENVFVKPITKKKRRY